MKEASGGRRGRGAGGLWQHLRERSSTVKLGCRYEMLPRSYPVVKHIGSAYKLSGRARWSISVMESGPNLEAQISVIWMNLPNF